MFIYDDDDPIEDLLRKNCVTLIEGVTLETDFDYIKLYSLERWSGVRYYLRELKGYRTLNDLGANIETIVNDIRNLKMLRETSIRTCVKLLQAAYLYYGLR